MYTKKSVSPTTEILDFRCAIQSIKLQVQTPHQTSETR